MTRGHIGQYACKFFSLSVDLFKNFNLAHSFHTVQATAFIFSIYSPWFKYFQFTSVLTPFVTLSLWPRMTFPGHGISLSFFGISNLSGLSYHRLTSESSDVGLVVKETSLPEVLSPGKWQHVVLSYLEDLDGSTLAGKVGQIESKPGIGITKIRSKM